MKLGRALAALALALVPLSVVALERSATLGGVDVVIWEPDVAPSGPLPVVVFSHGLYMCATQSRFLTEALASAGYFVVAPNHRDSACSFTMRWSLWRNSAKPFNLWSDDDYRDRGDDIRRVVDALRSDPAYGDADTRRLALVGHSLGGYTVLGLAGAWPSWTLSGVKAVLALAPYSLPFKASGGLTHLQAPVMYQAGTMDWVFTPPLREAVGGSEESPQPRYYVEIDSAWHLAWTDVGAMRKERIVAYAIAFLDRYVKDAEQSPLLESVQTRTAGMTGFFAN